ncbi:unnamed protein product [Rotaria sordida]|uniref:Uncharacterized protein n=1 Tax=Rotaria sordida TaxID=392033 RepID=A0A818ULC4_9BILA|nr:unnamed protein product [Rotaria sordida]CAF3699676.1 unnamed protein product [Rotaria sordida]
MYQIHQSLTYTLFHSKNASTFNNRFTQINGYSKRLNQQIGFPYDLIRLNNEKIISRISWLKRDSSKPTKVQKPLPCFFNTVTCFG